MAGRIVLPTVLALVGLLFAWLILAPLSQWLIDSDDDDVVLYTIFYFKYVAASVCVICCTAGGLAGRAVARLCHSAGQAHEDSAKGTDTSASAAEHLNELVDEAMTEVEWHSCPDPERMLAFLRGKASDRKLRLFAVACCRRLWSLLTDVRSRKAVELAEEQADRSGEHHNLRLAEQAAKAAVPSLTPGDRFVEQAAAVGARSVANDDAAEAARLTCGWVRNVTFALALEGMPDDLSRAKNQAFADWHAQAVALLRDIFSGPLRAPAFGPALLSPNIVALAHNIYEERKLPEGALDPARLGLLAEALEAAGCTDAELLAHLRAVGPHVRGCWALDAVLGRT